MKKILSLMLATFALSSCNDDCDHGFGTEVSISDILVGSWYEETLNEEDSYSASGSLYGKFCNTTTQGEGNGRYFIDSEKNRLTWSYTVNGSPQTSDWKLTNVSELGFTMSSDVALLTYGKIVETYKMERGESKQLSFNKEVVLGYESNNSNIASVSSTGLVTATGEKGTAYIKLKMSHANVWAKVVVGDDTPDLWIDYSRLLGHDFNIMKDMLGAQNTSQDFGDYTSYTYMTSAHNILNQINVCIDNTSHMITQIDMYLKTSVTQEEILAYMNSHYYRIEGSFAHQYHYSTLPTIEESRATFAYDTERKTVIIMSKDDYVDFMNPAPWPDLNACFGLTKEQVKSEMDKRGYTFYQSMDNYSFNGSDAYFINTHPEVFAIEFVYNPNNVVSEYWVYLSGQTDEDLYPAYDYLNAKYTEAKDEEVPGFGNIFYNRARTLKVKLDVFKHAVAFYDMTLQSVDRVILGNFWQGLGKTENELIAEFGEPYLKSNNDQGNLQYQYMVIDDYVTSATCNFNRMTKKVNLVNVFLRDGVSASVVKSYFNRLYTFKGEEQSDNGPKLIWLNAASEDDADMKINFYPDYGVVAYAPLVYDEPATTEGVIPDYSLLIKNTAAQVKDKMGEPERELVGSYVYSLSGHEFVKRLFVKFHDNPITDNSLVSSITVNLQENHSQEKLLEYFIELYVPASEYTTSTAYGFKSTDGKVLIQYTPSSNSIDYLKSFGF